MYNKLSYRYIKNIILLLFLTFLTGTLVVSCTTNSTPVSPGNYALALVGHWQGTIGNYYKENVSFKKDSSFNMQMHSGGFIGNTISQGVYGSASGSWHIDGNQLLLDISRADNRDLFNRSRTYKILSFTQDEVKLEDESGETSVFVRIRGM